MSQSFASDGQSTGVSASASVLPMNTQDWSLRMDWLDLLAVQGTLESLLQHHSSKASILWCSAFFIVQLSHPYIRVCSYSLLLGIFPTQGSNLRLLHCRQILYHLSDKRSTVMTYLPPVDISFMKASTFVQSYIPKAWNSDCQIILYIYNIYNNYIYNIYIVYIKAKLKSKYQNPSLISPFLIDLQGYHS